MNTAQFDSAGLVTAIDAAAWAALVSVAGAVIGWLTTRNKNKADVTQVLSETSIEWIRELRDETDRLRDRIEEFEEELALCEARNGELVTQYENLVGYLRKMGLNIPAE